jgi:hypothetical protein
VSEEVSREKQSGAMMGFRGGNAKKSRMPADMAKRQGDIATLAFMLLGGRDGAVSFLNSTNRSLGARPIDLAIASDEGFARVEKAINRMAASRDSSS